MRKFVIIVVLIGFFATFLTSCDSNKVYEEYIELEDYTWKSSQPLEYEFEISDTTELYDVYINVRHANQYPYNNLWLCINSWSPAGVKQTDTIECILADDKGKWLGSGLGDIWDRQIVWKKNVRFPMKGKYHVEYNQFMRVDDLVGIMDMGLRVQFADSEE